MESNGIQPPWTSVEPETEDEQIRRVIFKQNAWVKATYYPQRGSSKRRVSVFQAETVYVGRDLCHEVMINGRPRYFTSLAPEFEPISEAEALAWLAEHGQPLPKEEAKQGEEARQGEEDTLIAEG